MINPEPDRKGKQAATHPTYTRQETDKKSGEKIGLYRKKSWYISNKAGRKQGRMKPACKNMIIHQAIKKIVLPLYQDD
jgi:hypothetical protein